MGRAAYAARAAHLFPPISTRDRDSVLSKLMPPEGIGLFRHLDRIVIEKASRNSAEGQSRPNYRLRKGIGRAIALGPLLDGGVALIIERGVGALAASVEVRKSPASRCSSHGASRLHSRRQYHNSRRLNAGPDRLELVTLS